ncbi:MAG: phosphatase PAP2 family protein [Promethearchaeota archaeon]|nr:MAG: phosphatase PAP2 family protein [Candidatus Lokiarchaeota archaeon]
MEIKGIIKSIDKWDQSIILKINGRGGKFITTLLRLFSFLGRETIWLFLLAYFSFVWFDPKIFSYIGVDYTLGLIIIVPIKQIVHRTRPFNELEKIIVYERKSTSGSFPSWHSYNTASQAIIMGYLFSSSLLTIIFLFIAGVVAYSRVHVGSHYPSDVINGYIIGIVAGLSSIFLFGKYLFNFIIYLNEISNINFVFYSFNPLIFSNIGYIMLCILTFGGIFILSIYRYLKGIL